MNWRIGLSENRSICEPMLQCTAVRTCLTAAPIENIQGTSDFIRGR